jgi:hypothetical protein
LSANGSAVPLQWALDFAQETDILDPEQAKKIKGAPKYTFDPAPGEGTITKIGQKAFTICFVAACKDQENTEMSLENRVDYPPGAMLAPRDWERVPFDGGPNGLGRIVGPAPVAALPPTGGNEFATVAAFEAQKLASLLGIQAGLHGQFRGTAPAVRSRRLYVSGESATGRQQTPPPRQPRTRRGK